MTGRSGRGTARQTFRFDGQLWEWFGKHTPEGTDRTDLLKAFILWWMHAGELPERPAPPPPRDEAVRAALEEEAKRQASKSAATGKEPQS